MKKSTGVVGVVVILGVAYLGATWYVGKQAQAAVERVVAQANERVVKMLGADMGTNSIRIEINDYQRGWFSSEVSYTLFLKDEDGKPLELKLHDKLQHGPLPVSALSSGDFMPMLAHSQAHLLATPATQKWFDSQNGKSPLNIETRVGFGGTGKSVWSFSPAELVEDGEKISFSGGAIEMDFTNDFNDNTATGQVASFSITNEQSGENLLIKNIQGSSKTTMSNENDVSTQSSATVDSLAIDSPDGGAVVLEKIAMAVDSQQKGKLLDGALRYDFGRIAVGEIDLGSVSVGAKARQLDVDALTELGKTYDAIVARADISADEELVLTDAEEAVMREKLVALLASSPSVSIDPLIWKNAHGESKAGLHLDLASPSNAQEQRTDVLLAEVLKRVKLDLTISKPMLIQAFGQVESDPQQAQQMQILGAMIYDQYVARLSGAGLVVVEGDTASAAILYENDKVDLNGQAMSVPEFLQRAMSAVM
ncbi:hypothetical protein CR159_01830 [Pollutimonas subterranea]|uniref:DUF945 domain-containing protein n=1 Tax=Pollutimonas subterranea TaxID=2045210 RepID=A0A2N4U9T6_9BURK|nr:YdgA family protein [Pollutimonas subterranea]PLC51785.1 hypothetical protein CR159_01830 [Pollutimonas subterranea]